MGEENINKLVRRYNHTLLCHCHTMTADKISLLYFVAMNCELWHLHRSRWRATWVRWSSSRMSWSASRMLLRSGSIFLHSLFLHKPLHFLITKNQGKITGILPWQKAVGGKGQKGLWWDFVNNLQCPDGHIHGIVDNGNFFIQEGVDRQGLFVWCWLHLWLGSLLKLDFRKQGLPSWQGSGRTLPLFSGIMMIRHRQLIKFLSD